jgi:hypothetical protein
MHRPNRQVKNDGTWDDWDYTDAYVEPAALLHIPTHRTVRRSQPECRPTRQQYRMDA